MSVITKDLGVATAYGYAKSKGYTGTEEEFAELMASYADVAQQAEAAAQDAEDAKDAAVSAKNDAQTAQTAAESAQAAAAGSAQTASTKASEASNSAQSAAGSASAAQTSATAASGSASTAQTAAQTATNKASEASSSASAASTAKTGAETARTGAQTAQTAAETAQANAEAAASSVSASAAQIEQNTEEIGAIKNDLSEKADKTDAYSAYIVETETGSIASFTDGADDVPVKDLTIAIEPVQSGSGDPSPSNVRPISGWTGANVTRTGKNLLKNEKTSETMYGVTFTCNNDGSISLSGTATQNINYIMRTGEYAFPNGTFTLSGCPSGGGASTYYLRLDNSAGQIKALDTGSGAQYTVTDGKSHVVYISVKTGVNADGLVFRPQIELGSTATAYEPYQGETVSIDWTTEAGTVYGGTLDVTTGVLTVDRGYYTTTLSTKNLLAEGAYDQYVFYSRLTGGYPVSAIEADTSIRPICNIAPYLYSNSQTSLHFYSSSDAFQVFVPSGTPETTVVEVMYFITQPQTYQLTPQEVATVLGQNNIFADTGNVTVQYRADTKLYIDKVVSA